MKENALQTGQAGIWRISQKFYSQYQHSWCPYMNSEFYHYYMQYLHQEKERWWH